MSRYIPNHIKPIKSSYLTKLLIKVLSTSSSSTIFSNHHIRSNYQPNTLSPLFLKKIKLMIMAWQQYIYVLNLKAPLIHQWHKIKTTHTISPILYHGPLILPIMKQSNGNSIPKLYLQWLHLNLLMAHMKLLLTIL